MLFSHCSNCSSRMSLAASVDNGALITQYELDIMVRILLVFTINEEAFGVYLRLKILKRLVVLCAEFSVLMMLLCCCCNKMRKVRWTKNRGRCTGSLLCFHIFAASTANGNGTGVSYTYYTESSKPKVENWKMVIGPLGRQPGCARDDDFSWAVFPDNLAHFSQVIQTGNWEQMKGGKP